MVKVCNYFYMFKIIIITMGIMVKVCNYLFMFKIKIIYTLTKGELRCLGSTQHLKNKYGAGYQLDVKWSGARMNSDWADLEHVLLKIFSGAQVLESFSDRRTYSVEQEAVQSLASAFQQLEKCKSQ